MKASTREYHLYMAKITNQVGRFEDMLDAMSKIATSDPELTAEEMAFLSAAYKNNIGSRRTAWRTLSRIEQKEEKKGSKDTGLLRSYKAKIEGELNKYCNEAINLIDSSLLDKAPDTEAKVSYHRMIGDCYRYIAECSSGAEREKAEQSAHTAYTTAIDMAKSLKTTNSIRLGVALNYSALLDYKNDLSKACQICKQAIDQATADIDQIQEEQQKNSSNIILQLLKDYLNIVMSKLQQRAINYTTYMKLTNHPIFTSIIKKILDLKNYQFNMHLAEEKIKGTPKKKEQTNGQIPSNEKKLYNPSKILAQGNDSLQKYSFLLKQLSNPQLKLLFRASQHDFSAKEFHRLCDGISDTVTIVRTEFGRTVAAYTPLQWGGAAKWLADDSQSSFLLQLELREKMTLIQPKYAIYNDPNFGPRFGGDLWINDRCNQGQNSGSGFPISYNCNGKYKTNQQSYTALCGNPNGYNFRVVDYEVFAMSK